MAGVFKGHAADAVFFCQLHGPVGAEQGVGDADAKVPVVILHRALGPYKLGTAFGIDQPSAHIVHKPRNTVEAVALHPVRAGLGMDRSAGLCLLLR